MSSDEPPVVPSGEPREVPASYNFSFSVRKWNFDDCIWFVIVVGIVLRFSYPFLDNPFQHLISDSDRHFRSATEALNYSIYSISDSLGYQIWLAAAARIFGKSCPVVATYAGLLSVATAYFYYMWFKLCMPTKRLAMIAYALIIWLPHWIKIYTYFLDETLLLPLTALMLYFGWRAKASLALKDCLWFGAFAGLSFITKATCAPLIAVTYIMIFLNMYKSAPLIWNRKNLLDHVVIRRLIPSVVVAACVALLAPISFYSRTGSWSMFLPAQARSNALYYQSGKKMMKVKNRYFDRLSGQWKEEDYWFGCPSYYTKQVQPLSEWITPRDGEVSVVIDYGKPPETRFAHDKIDRSFRRQFELYLENWIYLFVGFVWPTEFPTSTVNFERWLWPVFTLIIAAAAIKRKRLNQLDCLCFSMLLVLMFQQECGVEGRYRMVWEATVIPALVLALGRWAKVPPGDGQQSLITEDLVIAESA